mgnify:CR=1 FL=1
MPLLALFPGFAAQIQTAVPDKPGIAKFHRQLMTLLRRRVKTEFVGFESCYHTIIVSQYKDNGYGKSLIKRAHRPGSSRTTPRVGPRTEPNLEQSGGNRVEAAGGNHGKPRANRAEKPARIKYQEPPDALLHADSHPPGAWRIGSLRNGLNRRGRHASMRSFNVELYWNW